MANLLDRFRDQGPSRPRSKADTEKRRRVLIVLLIVAAILAVAATLGYGYYDTNYKPWHQPIVKVNSKVIRMRTFVKALRLNGVSDASSAPYIATALEDYELKKQYLKEEFDIEASQDEVDDKLWELMGLTDNSTEEDYDEQYKTWVEYLKTNLNGSTIKDLKELYLEPQVVEEKLREQIGERDYPTDGTVIQAQLQALLVKGSDNASLIRARWENGEAFDTLSTDGAVSTTVMDLTSDNTANWVAKGTKGDAFDNYTFSAPYGVLSDPIQDSDDTTSYWLVKVIGKEERTLIEADRTTLISKAYDQWLEDAKKPENNDIVYYLDKKSGTAKLTWALAHVTVSTTSTG